MIEMNKYIKFFSLSFLLASSQIFPCSTISYQTADQNTYVLKSFDFSNGNGYLFINKKNISKRSLVPSPVPGKSWVSKYGSITFNQASRDFPFGGVNEKGLNMEIMWLDETIYPQKNENDPVNESQIIQYVLDTASTTDEAINQIKEVDIIPIMAPVHYMICDTSNQCAVIEYLNQKLVITKMEKETERILQNSIYQEMLDNKLRKDGSTFRNSSSDLSSIFDIASLNTKEDLVKKSFEGLEIVKQGSWSKWQIVYNLKAGEVWFRTNANQKIKHVNIKDYELDCKKDKKELVVNMNSDFDGDVQSHLEEYTSDIDDTLLSSVKGVSNMVKKAVKAFSALNHKCE